MDPIERVRSDDEPSDEVWERVASGKTVSGLDLPSEDDPTLRGIAWRLRAYSEAMLDFTSMSAPDSTCEPLSLSVALEQVRQMRSAGDLPCESEHSVALAAALGLRMIDEFVAALAAGEGAVPLLERWDRICDAHCEMIGTWVREVSANGGHVRSAMARMAAQVRHSTSQYAEPREFINRCWHQWQADPSRYASLSSFARDMQAKFPEVIANPVTVERWVRIWRNEIRS